MKSNQEEREDIDDAKAIEALRRKRKFQKRCLKAKRILMALLGVIVAAAIFWGGYSTRVCMELDLTRLQWSDMIFESWDSKTTMAALSLFIAIISLGVATSVYYSNDIHKKRDRAMALLQSLMTTEFLTKARLVSQETLLNNDLYEGKNYVEIDEMLASSDKEDRERRFYIRAIPNFFRTVDIAREHGYIPKKENIFAEAYSWYWKHIIKDHCGDLGEYDPMFKKHEWMLKDSDGIKVVPSRAPVYTRSAKLAREGDPPPEAA